MGALLLRGVECSLTSPNAVISSLVILMTASFFGTSQLQYSTYWQDVLHWQPSEPVLIRFEGPQP